jgi:hypothetical protein
MPPRVDARMHRRLSRGSRRVRSARHVDHRQRPPSGSASREGRRSAGVKIAGDPGEIRMAGVDRFEQAADVRCVTRPGRSPADRPGSPRRANVARAASCPSRDVGRARVGDLSRGSSRCRRADRARDRGVGRPAYGGRVGNRVRSAQGIGERAVRRWVARLTAAWRHCKPREPLPGQRLWQPKVRHLLLDRRPVGRLPADRPSICRDKSAMRSS